MPVGLAAILVLALHASQLTGGGGLSLERTAAGAATLRGPPGAGLVRLGRGRLSRSSAVLEAAREVWVAHPRGLEVSWALERLPEGRGPLRVRLPFPDRPAASADARGLLLGEGAVRLRIEPAVFIDAAGRRWPLATTWRAGELLIEVPESALAEATWPAVVDPVISVERLYGTRDSSAAAPRDQVELAVAAGDGQYLAVWQDHRAGPKSIWGTRVSAATGQPLDPNGLTIAAGTGAWCCARAASNGAIFLVAYSDLQNGTLFGTRVSSQGALLDGGGFVIANGPAPQAMADVAWDGANFAVVWVDNPTDMAQARLWGVHVSAQAAVGTPVALTPAGGTTRRHPRLAALSDGTGVLMYRVAWLEEIANSQQPSVVTALYGSDWSAGAAPLVLQTQVEPLFHRPSVSGTPDSPGSLVAWSSQGTGGAMDFDIAVTRFGRNGALLDASPLVLTSSSNGNFVREARWDGTRHVVVFDAQTQRSFGIHATVMPAMGPGLVDVILVLNDEPDYQFYAGAAVRPDGGELFVAWGDERDGALHDAWGTRATGVGLRPLDDAGVLLSRAASSSQLEPWVSFGGGEHLLAWSELAPAGPEVRVARVGADGVQLSTERRLTGPGELPGAARVASNGPTHVVAWSSRNGGVGAQLFAPASPPLTLAGLTPPFAPVRVAPRGSGFMLAWLQSYGTYRLWTQGVSADGGVRPAQSVDLGQQPFGLEVAGWSDEHLFVWESRLGANAEVVAAQLLPDGGLSTLVVGSSSTTLHGNPAVAVVPGTDEYLVAWLDQRANVVLSRKLGPMGALGAVTTVSSAFVKAGPPVVSWDGVRFIVAWAPGTWPARDVMGAAVSRAGAVTEQFVVGSATDVANVAVSGSSGGRALVVFERFVTDGGNSRELVGHTVALEVGQSCTMPGQCPSGYCVDGVCCDDGCGNGVADDCLGCSVSAGAATDGRCQVIAADRVCRAPAAECDKPETCDGVGASCPANGAWPNGVACTGGACMGGQCVLGAVPDAGPPPPFDGGVADGGSSDGGAPGERRLGVACGCAASAADLSLAALWAALAHARRRPFRRRAARSR